ncbi:hypothetical protein APHAL10511_004590 [Amanita phalloides]|nr:hypothetical protein APHAL10511_004590 [Amanita phalloides]
MWKSQCMAVNHHHVVRKNSTYDHIVEFSGDLYLVESGSSSDECDAREGDLIKSWDVEHPVANEVVSLIGSDCFSDELRLGVFWVFKPLTLLHQKKKKKFIIVTDANVHLS